MTNLQFKDALTENTFSYSNSFMYQTSDYESFGMFFAKDSDNYPYILKGGVSDEENLEYCAWSYQLQGRMLTSKKVKEVMNSARMPLYFKIRGNEYLIGKGFLSTYSLAGHKLLFIACINGKKAVSGMDQVRFYVSKDVYQPDYKMMQPIIKEITAAHPGDVMLVKDIREHIGEKIRLPKGGSLSSLREYKDAVVRTAFSQVLSNAPLPLETPEGTVMVEGDRDPSMRALVDVMRARIAMEHAGTITPPVQTYTYTPPEENAFVSVAARDETLPF